MYYLQTVCIRLKEKEERKRFLSLEKALEEKGIAVKEDAPISGPLWITDCGDWARELAAAGGAVLAYCFAGNQGEDFSGVKYLCQEPESLEIEYLEQVYRRLTGVPWDILDTERCYLRETTEEDVEEFYRIYKEPSITEYMEDLYPDMEQEKAYIREYREKVYAFCGFGVWTIWKRDTKEVIGRAGFSWREGFAEPELGFVIGVPWQKQGFAYEVCRAVLRYGAERLGFETVQALVEPHNKGSLRLCGKLGMEFQGKVTIQGKEFVRLIKRM